MTFLLSCCYVLKYSYLFVQRIFKSNVQMYESLNVYISMAGLLSRKKALWCPLRVNRGNYKQAGTIYCVFLYHF